ncbi:MAG: metallopeptidase family protein [Paracoccaceae bacterium]|nr:metallopeptidase family protein [Paracoccaceae bacterium]
MDVERMDWTDATAPDAAEIEAMARDAVESLPEMFRDSAKAVVLHVKDFATDDILESLGLDDPFEVTGLYDGIPLTEKSVSDQPEQPDTIWLFRRPILEEWVERGDVALAKLVAHVMIHEIAHHFGWTDDDIAAIDAWWT